jgi:uncharacterized protein (TIGR04255 family)
MEGEVQSKISTVLPDYPTSNKEFRKLHALQVSPKEEPKITVTDEGIQGWMFKSQDQKQIARFHKQMFSFSRLEPYETWDNFREEGLRLWSIHQGHAKIQEIQRAGLRTINRFLLPQDGAELNDYFRDLKIDIDGLEFLVAGFLHQDSVIFPGLNYQMNVIKTLQQVGEPAKIQPALILDIDVFTLQVVPYSVDSLKNMLEDMHWIRNKAFHGIVTGSFLEKLK